jgi:hypothetical protein
LYFGEYDGESLSSDNARLDALRMKIQGLGCDKYKDGFDVDDDFIKSNIISMIALGNKKLALNMQFLDSRKKMTRDDLVSNFIANEKMAAQGKKINEIVHALNSPNLTVLKSK